MTSPTPCIEQKRFLKSLGFEELKDHDTDFQVAWIFRTKGFITIIMLAPDEVPTAKEVLDKLSDAAYRKGVADMKKHFQEALKVPCLKCNGARYIWLCDHSHEAKQVKCSACNP